MLEIRVIDIEASNLGAKADLNHSLILSDALVFFVLLFIYILPLFFFF